MFFEPERTAYDLRWRMLGAEVRVHPWFWVVSFFMGSDLSKLGFQYVLLWMACVFVSILLHEFGHVLVGRLFGSEGHIILYSFGGLAVGSNRLPSRWQRVAVSFAGPAAQLCLYGVLWLIYESIDRTALTPPLQATFLFLFEINLFWSLLNLLPVWPLDGGMIARELLGGLFPREGRQLSLGISFLCAGILAVHSFFAWKGYPFIPYLEGIGSLYTGILFAMLAVGSFQAMRDDGPRRFDPDDPDRSRPWEGDPDAWKR
jgi:Zn-dependent protease